MYMQNHLTPFQFNYKGHWKSVSSRNQLSCIKSHSKSGSIMHEKLQIQHYNETRYPIRSGKQDTLVMLLQPTSNNYDFQCPHVSGVWKAKILSCIKSISLILKKRETYPFHQNQKIISECSFATTFTTDYFKHENPKTVYICLLCKLS